MFLARSSNRGKLRTVLKLLRKTKRIKSIKKLLKLDLVETSNQITHQFLDVTETEQAGTAPGERSFFGGANFKLFEEVPRASDGKIVADYTVAYFTTNVVAGLTLNFKYRRIRLPTVFAPFKVAGFFTNIEQGFVGQFHVVKRHQTDEYTDYDLFFSWQTGSGGTPVASADLYLQQQKTQDSGSQIVQYPNFPQSTDPFQGGNAKHSDVGGDVIFDTFLLALP